MEEKGRADNRKRCRRGAQRGGLKISGGFWRSGLHADVQWQLYMLTTTSGDADTNPN